MKRISAFVGHSFLERDEAVVRLFLSYFDALKDMEVLQWEHAENAEAKILSEKVKDKMMNKELFIGICTAREYAFDKDSIIKTWLRGRVSALRSNTRVKTSDWILQEIGMAFGRNMALMLLVEEGVSDVGGLQGDIEYIPFPRNNPQKCFGKILQFIKSLQPDSGAGTAEIPPTKAASSIEPPVVETPQGVTKGDAETETPSQWEMPQFLYEQAMALFEKDEAREQEVGRLFRASEQAKDAFNVTMMESDRLYWRQTLNIASEFEALRSLATANPLHPHAHAQLADLYRNFDNHADAAQHETVCAENAKSKDQRVRSLFRAARDYLKQDDSISRDGCIQQAAEIARSDATVFALYCELRADLERESSDGYAFIAHAERALRANPSIGALRFALAYKSSELDLDALAYYHYQLKANEQPDDHASVNNLGAAGDLLELSGKAGAAYKSAAENGSARAYGNLAFRYLRAGLFDEVEKCVAQGVLKDATDSRVAEAVAELRNLREQEGNKEKEILKDARNHQRFFLSFADALDESCPDMNGTSWKVSACTVAVAISDKRFYATGTYERTVRDGLLGNALAGLAGTDKPETEQVTITFEGPIRGATVHATRTEKIEGGRRGGALTILSEVPNKKEVLLLLTTTSVTMLELVARNHAVSEWIKLGGDKVTLLSN